MTLTYYEMARTRDAALRRVPAMAEHVRTYRKFVFYARIAAFALPFFLAFVLYWTT